MNSVSIGNAPMRESPGGKYIQRIPKGAVVTFLDSKVGPYKDAKIEWANITYRGTDGWVYSGYLEPYVDSLPVDVFRISLATTTQYDVPQNLIWNGHTMVNQCGELCVSYIFDIDIAELLEKWKRKNSWYYRYTFGSSKDRGTDQNSLLDMLSAYDSDAVGVLYSNILRDSVRNLVEETPHKVSVLLHKYHIVTGVTISRTSGKLAPKGILHWVVLEAVVANRDGGIVYLANPYHNRIEMYSWEEYKASAGYPDGIAIPRRRAFNIPAFSPPVTPQNDCYGKRFKELIDEMRTALDEIYTIL